MTGYQDSELLPLSGLQHLSFCERQWALIHIEMQWQEDQHTAEGRAIHERVHDPAQSGMSAGKIIERGLPIRSQLLGVVGEADVVEFHSSETGAHIPGRKGFWRIVPIEYKRGKPKETTNADHIQLCAQAICLEEMLDCSIPVGYMFYNETRHRQRVEFTDSLRKEISQLAKRMHELYNLRDTPRAEMKLSVCRKCSIQEICSPRIFKNRKVSTYWQDCLSESNSERTVE